MLDWSIEQDQYPVAIRIPSNGVIHDGREVDTDYLKINTFKVEEKGSKVAILALGDFYQIGQEVVQTLKEQGIDATLINPRYITGLDQALLESLKENHELVITLEDGILDGGFGQKVASYYGDSSMKVLNYGLEKEFYDRYVIDEILKENRCTTEQIIEDIKRCGV
jgi:1-deoxy-D-xylulose-5-phosphate synthase